MISVKDRVWGHNQVYREIVGETSSAVRLLMERTAVWREVWTGVHDPIYDHILDAWRAERSGRRSWTGQSLDGPEPGRARAWTGKSLDGQEAGLTANG